MGHHGGFTGPLLASTLAALRPAHHPGATGLLPGPGQAAMTMGGGSLMNPTPVAGFGPVTNKFDNAPCNTLFIGGWPEFQASCKGLVIAKLSHGSGRRHQLLTSALVCVLIVLLCVCPAQATWATRWTRRS